MELLSKKLIELKFPNNTSRQNVLKEGDKSYEGFVAGYVRNLWGGVNKRGYSVSKKKISKRCEEVYELACKLGLEQIPDFKFTSIQFNKNYKIAKHIDRNNSGKSYIIALGDFEGGDLLVYFDGKDAEPTRVNIKNKFYTFDGNKYYHEVDDFTGNRISLVYYNVIKDFDILKEDFIKNIQEKPYVVAYTTDVYDINKMNINLEIILDSGIPSDRIFVFCKTSEILKKYKKTLDENKYCNLVIGNRNKENQDEFIIKYFPENTNIVFMREGQDPWGCQEQVEVQDL